MKHEIQTALLGVRQRRKNIRQTALLTRLVKTNAAENWARAKTITQNVVSKILRERIGLEVLSARTPQSTCISNILSFCLWKRERKKKKAKKLLYIELITDDVKRPLPPTALCPPALLTPPPPLPLYCRCVRAWLSSNMHDEVRGGVLRAVLLSSLSCSSACGDCV